MASSSSYIFIKTNVPIVSGGGGGGVVGAVCFVIQMQYIKKISRPTRAIHFIKYLHIAWFRLQSIEIKRRGSRNGPCCEETGSNAHNSQPQPFLSSFFFSLHSLLGSGHDCTLFNHCIFYIVIKRVALALEHDEDTFFFSRKIRCCPTEEY